MRYDIKKNGCEKTIRCSFETAFEVEGLDAIFSTNFINKVIGHTREQYEQSNSMRAEIDWCINGEHNMDRWEAGQYALDTVCYPILDNLIDNHNEDIDCILENFTPSKDEKEVLIEIITKTFTIAVLLAIEFCTNAPFFVQEYILSANYESSNR